MGQRAAADDKDESNDSSKELEKLATKQRLRTLDLYRRLGNVPKGSIRVSLALCDGAVVHCGGIAAVDSAESKAHVCDLETPIGTTAHAVIRLSDVRTISVRQVQS